MRYFKGNNYNYVYHKILRTVLKNPDFIGGSTMQSRKIDSNYREIVGITFVIENPVKNRIYNPVRSVDYDYAEKYYNFLISGENNIDVLAEDYPKIKEFVNRGSLPENFSTLYGPRILDQLPNILKLLKEKPTSRWATINVLYREDKKIWDAKTTMEYPCCMNLQFFIRENKLQLVVNMRSNNIFSTVCYDVYLFTKLQSHVADLLKIKTGKYIHQINSAHLYGKDYERAKSTIKKYDKSGVGINLDSQVDQLKKLIDKNYLGKYNKSEIDPKPYILGKKLGMGFNIGNSIKYLSRYVSNSGLKRYNEEDLLKSIHYILFEIKRRSIEK